MFIRFFKARYFAQYVALFFLAAILWIDLLIAPSAIAPGGSCENFYGLTGLFQNYPIILVIISILLLLFQAIVLNQVMENHRLIERNQMLTAAIYVLIVSSSPVSSNPIMMLLTNFILILTLNIVLNIYGKKEPYRQVFDAAFLIGIASLLYSPVIFFIIFLWACLVLYQIFTGREWLISIVGVVIPHLFAGTYFFITDQFESEFNVFISFFTQIQIPEFTQSIYLYIVWGIITILTFISLGQISRGLTENTISLRKKFRTIVIFFIVSLGSAIFSGNSLMLHLVIAAIPTAIFITSYLSKTKRQLIPDIMLVLLFITILLGKYFNLS